MGVRARLNTHAGFGTEIQQVTRVGVRAITNNQRREGIQREVIAGVGMCRILRGQC